MKTTFIIALLIAMLQTSIAFGQIEVNCDRENPLPPGFSFTSIDGSIEKKAIALKPLKWKMTGNRIATGALVLTAGAAKGFNETLMFHWKIFHRKMPHANPNWFNPDKSWKNKYKDGNPQAGPKSFLSTTALVMFTDQYHLNNFINKAAWTTAFVIKIGEKKKPLKHYLLDLVYYTACHQAGFAATYYPFKK